MFTAVYLLFFTFNILHAGDYFFMGRLLLLLIDSFAFNI